MAAPQRVNLFSGTGIASPYPETPGAFAAAARAQEKARANDKFGFLKQEFARPVPSIKEEAFGKWDIEVPQDDDDLAALQRLHVAAVAGHDDELDTIEQVAMDDDPTLNNEGRLKIVGSIVEPKLEQLTETAKREFDRVTESLATVRADIYQAIRQADPIDIPLHDGIRQHWRESKDPQLAKEKAKLTISEELFAHREPGEEGSPLSRMDMMTLQALGAGPAYLSGLTEAQQGAIRQELTRRLAPKLAARADALIAGRAKAAQALSALDTTAKRLIDFNRARKLREREAQRTARNQA